MWQRLSAVRMFIEHVYPTQDETDSQDLQNILKLWKVNVTFRLAYLTLTSVADTKGAMEASKHCQGGVCQLRRRNTNKDKLYFLYVFHVSVIRCKLLLEPFIASRPLVIGLILQRQSPLLLLNGFW